MTTIIACLGAGVMAGLILIILGFRSSVRRRITFRMPKLNQYIHKNAKMMRKYPQKCA